MRRSRTVVQEARREEQLGNLPRAIELYRKALRRQEKDADAADPNLYNQLGDLYVRSGDPKRGLECYSEAVDTLEGLGLSRAAIALCKKILRNAPARADIWLRTARLQARAGLMAEARESYIEFASRMDGSGELDQAVGALNEFAELSDDEEVRLALADRYVVADRTERAVEQLERVHRRRSERGLDAYAILERIADLDPEWDPESSSTDSTPSGKPSAAEAENGGASPTAEGGEARPEGADISGLAAELQAVLVQAEGEERLRHALPLIDRLLDLEPHQIDLLQRKMNYALALGDEERVLEAYEQLGLALQMRVSGFRLRVLRADSSAGVTTAAVELGARAASAPGR